MLARLLGVLRRHGPFGFFIVAARKAKYAIWELTPAGRRFQAVDLDFDRRYGVETAAQVPASALDLPAQATRHAVKYQAVAEVTFERALALSGVDPSGCIFVDLGCGKGRAVMLASRHPFSKILGVELSSGLAEIARRNVAAFGVSETGCRNIEIETGDATSFKIPRGRVLVFLYNPFDGVLLERVLASIWAQRVDGDDLTIVYVDPIHHDVVAAQPFIETVASRGDVTVYRVRNDAV